MFDMTEEDVIEFIKDFKPDEEFETTLHYERIDISGGVDIDQTSVSKECIICHYWYFKDFGFKFKTNICDKCYVRCIFSISKPIEILNVKGVDCRCILCGISRNKAISIINNSVLEDKGVLWILAQIKRLLK